MTRRAALGGTAGFLLAPAAMAAPTYQGLFRIERSKNANIVQYDAVLQSFDKLDPAGPVVAYWVLHAEDGRREGLSSIDRRAYGFKVKAEVNNRWLLYLNASPDRSIRVLRWQGRWVAQIVIAGRSAVLDRMYVSTDESAFIPRVLWVDLFGADMETGKPLTERLKP